MLDDAGLITSHRLPSNNGDRACLTACFLMPISECLTRAVHREPQLTVLALHAAAFGMPCMAIRSDRLVQHIEQVSLLISCLLPFLFSFFADFMHEVVFVLQQVSDPLDCKRCNSFVLVILTFQFCLLCFGLQRKCTSRAAFPASARRLRRDHSPLGNSLSCLGVMHKALMRLS